MLPLLLLMALFLTQGSLLASSNTPNITLGINYGMVADNLPPPHTALELIKSLGISKVKIYSTNATTLHAFADAGVSFIIGIGNEDLHSLADPHTALAWVQSHVLPFIHTTPISAIAVGNEVLTTNDTQLISNLLPAMLNLHSALSTLPPSSPPISISTPHSLAILSSSYPPSIARFDPSLVASSLKPLALFLSQTHSPFMINAYPYFAYKYNPTTISLPYVLFQSSDGVQDTNTGLLYDNMLDAQVDAIYSALEALGFSDLKVIVTETGWPSQGDANEPGASQKNAQAYNSNLVKRVASQKGTPMRPNLPLEAYIFALFNEDSKVGPTSERHYGLFKPDGTQAYDLGLGMVGPNQGWVNPSGASHNYRYYHSTSASSHQSQRDFIHMLTIRSTLLVALLMSLQTT